MDINARGWRGRGRVLRTVLIGGGILALVALGAAGGACWRSAESHRVELLAEIRSLPEFPGARLTRETASNKFDQAAVERAYLPQNSVSALRAFYDDVLAQRGWTVLRTVRFSDGDSVCYGHAENRALLTVLDSPTPTWAWTLSLAWGNAGC